LLLGAYATGIAATGAAMLLAQPLVISTKQLFVHPGAQNLFHSFITAATIEEGVKFLAFLVVIYRSPQFDEIFDGILYAVMISLGFATFENVLYLMNSYSTGGALLMFQTGALRALLTIPVHAFCGVFMGYYFGRAKFALAEKSRGRLFLKGLGGAILAHGLFDAFAMSKSGRIMCYVVFAVCGIVAQRLVERQASLSHGA
jgi:RsiW-degrading membrane proteinase PrsW (M82 family)